MTREDAIPPNDLGASSIKILLIGDHSIFRSALRSYLERDKKLRVVGEASEIDKAAEILAIERPDLLLVDLPDAGENELMDFLKTMTTPVVMLVGHHDIEIYQRCLRIGISGLVHKEERGETLFKAIEKVSKGEIWFDRTIMGETIRQLLAEKQSLQDNPKPHVSSGLTTREKEVIELICKGLKNKSIAEKLFISETTVRHHLTSVFSKLDISSRLELVVYAFRNNLVRTPERNGMRKENGATGEEMLYV